MILKRPDVLEKSRASMYYSQNTNQRTDYWPCPWDGYGTAFTTVMWMRPTGAITGNPYIYGGFDSPSTNTWGARLYDWSGVDRILVFRPDSRYKCSYDAFSFNTWQHLAVIDRGDPTIAGGGNYTIYLDGTDAGSQATGSGTSTEVHPDFLNIGRRPAPSGADYKGNLAHFAMFNRELRPSEIIGMSKGKSPLWYGGCIFYVPFTEREGIEVISNTHVERSYTNEYVSHDNPLPVDIIQPPWVVLPQRFFNFPIGITATTLTVDNLSQSSTVDKVAVTTTYNATVDNLSQANTVQKPSLTQVHVLIVQNLSQSNAVEKIDLVLQSALAVYNLSQANAVDKITLTQLHILQVDNLSQSSTVDSIILQAQGYLAVYPLGQSSTVDHITTTKQSDIDLYDLSQANTVDKISLSAALINLVVEDLSQSNTVQTLGVFLQYATVYPRDLSVGSTVSHLSLTSIHNLGIDDLSQTNTVDKVAVWANNNMVVIDLSQANLVTTTTFTQVHNLVIPGAYITSTVDHTDLWDWWYETIEEVGLVTQSVNMVGYIRQDHEEYGYIEQSEEQDGLIVQEVDEDGSIVQTYDVEGPITRTYEQVGEL